MFPKSSQLSGFFQKSQSRNESEMVFIRREARPETGFTVGVMLNNTATKGEIGIEIECEGNKFEKENPAKGWSFHQDNSLRGNDNAEYVSTRPIMFSEVPDAIERLWAMFAKTGTVLDDSNRTSVHLHVNCQDFHLNRLTSFLAIYYTLEEILTQWCGEYRVGNLFCLRAKDAPAIINHVRRFIKSDGREGFRENVHHYAACNTFALHKFGSLEFRTLRGCTDPGVILDWVSIIQRLYELSANYSDPRTVCEGFSSDGPLAMFENLLGDRAYVVRSALSWSDEQIRESMYEGIRLAQDICYCRDWDVFSPVELRNDPFGRDAKKMMQKLQDIEGGGLNASYDDMSVVSTTNLPLKTGTGVVFGNLQQWTTASPAMIPPTAFNTIESIEDLWDNAGLEEETQF